MPQCISLLLNQPSSNVRTPHVTHQKIVFRTIELAMISQRPFFLWLFNVILLPLYETFSQQQTTNVSVIKLLLVRWQDVLRWYQALISLIYHQLLKLHQYQGKVSIWKDHSIFVSLCLISTKKFNDWMNVVAAS